ncbi:MAG: hypothetical protein JRG91_09810, partial [Deltaproteobacteria bacterium]|nr:hypothetical protein [Deltaproteobacteria bacterium]
CGACEDPCVDGLVCESGACIARCVSPFVSCSGVCSDTSMDPDNCGSCGSPCPIAEACIDGTCEPFVGNVGTARMSDGTWIPVIYQLCGGGAPGSCTAIAAKATCSGIGGKVVSHASDGTTDVLSLGATVSCSYSVSYYTAAVTMPSGSCLVGIANLDWTSCCTLTRWHGNTIAFGTAGAVFGYVTSASSGYVSTYPNVTGATWGCTNLTSAASNFSGCTEQYVACSM